MTTYIVVADAARARIFTRDGIRLTEQESLVHAEGRLHEGDLITDGRGDIHESTATSTRSSGGEDVALHHHAELFAKQVAERLYRARIENRMAKLILVAPPQFLGLMRDKLDDVTGKLILHSLSKDLSKAALETIQNAVRELR
ncbi:host attachment protein [Aidingimonas lacisalsi]|uniref:host attachment protein n=1 Tax=Aidingimonas lacisalsi TaxID=2604086 RepID=UPI0011D18AED|nr:host attachment protein [Aidingimonas lacisalsi]